MLQYAMRSFGLALLLTLAQPVTAETWIHVYGRSWHDQAGYREINTGVGIEQKFAPAWSWAAGTFQNSEDRQSVVVMAKYHWIDHGSWAVRWQLGAVTGYRRREVAPVILPELCWSWVCGMIIPNVGQSAAAAAVYLRVPL
jgi:hypothetical protein